MSQRTAYGGQAVIEGVMIRGREHVATACRLKDGEITVQHGKADSIARHPFWRLAFVRGTPALVDSLRLGYRTLLWSADLAAEGEEIKKPTPLAYALSIAVALAFGIGLFVLLPSAALHWAFPPAADAPPATSLLDQITPSVAELLPNFVEGLVRVVILVLYILLISRMAEVRRIFAYHGAEHKVVNGWEAGAGLTVDAVRPYSRIHPRCGTSFIFLFFIVGILVHAVIGWPDDILIRLGSRLLMIPIIAGIAYELIRLAGRFRRAWLLQAMVWPGMLLQRLTTAEPEDDQIEVALAAMRGVLEAEGVITPPATPDPATLDALPDVQQA